MESDTHCYDFFFLELKKKDHLAETRSCLFQNTSALQQVEMLLTVCMSMTSGSSGS